MSGLNKCDICGKLAFEGATVTISATEYETLRKTAADVSTRKTNFKYRSVSHSVIARNPQLADFILVCIETMTIAETYQAAVARFGEKVSSKSSIHRFIQAMKFQH